MRGTALKVCTVRGWGWAETAAGNPRAPGACGVGDLTKTASYSCSALLGPSLPLLGFTPMEIKSGPLPHRTCPCLWMAIVC